MNDTQEEALNVFRKYDRAALPVVDSNGVLVGIVTIDDMLDVAEEEATEDIQKFGGMEALDEPYMRIPLWQMVRKARRLAGHFVSRRNVDRDGDGELPGRDREGGRARAVSAADHFERRQFRSQASTLIIRAMALGEVTLRDWWRVMRAGNSGRACR